jgi:hypothetical protein
MGFAQVSVSHEVSPLIKLVGRGDTTVVDAYLSPILRRYVAQVAEEMSAGEAAGSASPSPGGGGSPAAGTARCAAGWGDTLSAPRMLHQRDFRISRAVKLDIDAFEHRPEISGDL